MIHYYAMTQKGQNHEENEDRVLVGGSVLASSSLSGVADKTLLSAIYDGVGSYTGGATAAQTAAEVFSTYRNHAFSDLSLRCVALAANEEILAEQKQRPQNSKMSTTATGISIRSRKVLIFHVGDSRLYRYSDGCMKLLTEDHTPAWKLYQAGRISDPRRAPASYRKTVTQYFGGCMSRCIPSFYYDSIPTEGCVYVICSDGVWSKVKEEELYAILQEKSGLERKGRAIVEIALHNGSADDLSLVLILCVPIQDGYSADSSSSENESRITSLKYSIGLPSSS